MEFYILDFQNKVRLVPNLMYKKLRSDPVSTLGDAFTCAELSFRSVVQCTTWTIHNLLNKFKNREQKDDLPSNG